MGEKQIRQICAGVILTAATSSNVTVTTTAIAKLQLLMPGETAAPGTLTGKTGLPTAQTAGTSFNVIVNAVDANWNVVSTNDTVTLAASDLNAVLPGNTPLVNGTKTVSVTLKTAGSATLTASDFTHPTVLASSSPTFVVNPGAFTKLHVLAPGDTAAPATLARKTGTAAAH